MFVSNHKNTTMKKFQKPNILRKKSKVSLCRLTKLNDHEAPSEKTILTSPYTIETFGFEKDTNKYNKFQDNSSHTVKKIATPTIIQKNIEEQYVQIHEDRTKALTETVTSEENDSQIKYEFYISDVGNFHIELSPNITVPLSSISLAPVIENTKPNNEEFSTPSITVQDLVMEDFLKPIGIFKCDVDSCDKVFPTAQKLRKHKSLHNKDGTLRQVRQTTLECPVKKLGPNGQEERCDQFFNCRTDLVKHLNNDHSPEDAAYKCAQCERRFFCMTGLRGHARTHNPGRRLLACGWPGCGREFRQPCRLREHARAHTGDRPYPCTHPNCGWSFRTASKLVRHARRHTNERRHVCATCGRAYLRREHLRDHAARHHSSRVCPRPGCKLTFTNANFLNIHLKKSHKKEREANSLPPPVTSSEHDQPLTNDAENIFMLNLLEPSIILEGGEENIGNVDDVDIEGSVVSLEEESHGEGEGDGETAARTRCTWPLVRAPAIDPQVEQSESVESNIYTIRSDLFLHGNVIPNDDSEHMPCSVRVNEEGESGLMALSVPSLDTDLLLDAPTVDLAQEELYTDAVDESAFRVFLLSGEELL